SYILKIEEGTPFYAKREALDLPDEDEQAELYLFAVDYLNRLGYAQYEISNFAQPGFESRHNTLYWRCGAYIGIGPAAHSFYHGKRFHYARSMQAFCNDLLTDDGSGGDSEEYIMLALRLCEGLVFANYEQRFQKPLPAELHRKIEKYVKLGLMEADGQHACFTPKGFLVSNMILTDLL
ncbi:MAG: coproporphyrinogen III oxidase, partial [Ruminococcus sp.]|nr:coproporphyrinogen III oxidase [Ruminococcus sp.]